MSREHTTHHDDCGCLSARHAQEIADANAAIKRLAERAAKWRAVAEELAKVPSGLLGWDCDYSGMAEQNDGAFLKRADFAAALARFDALTKEEGHE